jgi:hypothetical protein
MKARLGADRRRGVSRRDKAKAGRWGVFCNPPVLRLLFVLARIIFELVRFFLRQ